ncbi:MAG: hypothetical protein AMXMBFR36_35580 [Acidobacteriota bacterium]
MVDDSRRREWRYRSEILTALDSHGFRPRGGVEPSRVYELLKSLYVWELRRLKLDLKQLDPDFGPATRRSLAEGNRRLLERYAVLRVPPHEWVER